MSGPKAPIISLSQDERQELLSLIRAHKTPPHSLWEKMRAFFSAYALESMRHLFEALYYGLNKSAPALAIDSY